MINYGAKIRFLQINNKTMGYRLGIKKPRFLVKKALSNKPEWFLCYIKVVIHWFLDSL